jgi:hypothetical protein
VCVSFGCSIGRFRSWEVSHLAGLVLGDLVLGVLLALLALAVGPARLRDVDL